MSPTYFGYASLMLIIFLNCKALNVCGIAFELTKIESNTRFPFQLILQLNSKLQNHLRIKGHTKTVLNKDIKLY